jgi:hypothetical protein
MVHYYCKLYKLSYNSYKEIPNSEMFLDPYNILFRRVKEEILKEVSSIYEYDDGHVCYDDFKGKLNDLLSLNSLDAFQIIIDGDGIRFAIDLDLYRACRSIDVLISTSIKIEEIINYIVLD